ncbi:oligosaccharide flippase family protein [Butyrivibrio sp. DSM 10294]|uniref:lipopolysaccharide biosynthesis protein n=1 Tax=Butyrivibrio sp. DSM 10294 TaxID=2972457 RepID=UPI00234E51BE|nr:oligosaccharide flippase family protein [Butyrivibrio sp. DSM 10294]MDC7292851.1 oligosaccharide flippase family protein [Butyrivibrio sp. DSM 10294]
MKKETLIKKYGNLPDSVKASAWNTFSSIIQKGISILTIPIFTRMMSTQEYGEVSLYSSWYAIIAIFGSLNLYHSTTFNGLTKFENDKNGVISSFQSLTFVLSAAIFLLSLIFKDYWFRLTGLSEIYILMICVSVASFSAFNYWTAKERYDYRYKSVVVYSLIISILSPILAIVLINTSKYKALARAIAYTIVQVIVGVIFLVYNSKNDRKYINTKYWKYALFMNIPLLPHYLSSIVLSESDRIIVGRICGKDSVALYSLAYNIGMMMIVVITAINNSITPYIFKTLKKDNVNNLKKISLLIAVFIMCMCMLSMTIGPEIVSTLGTKEYNDSIWIVPPIACSVYFCFLYPLFSTIELFFEKTFFVSVSSLIAAIINVALNYMFIPKYGFYAAAYTTLFSYIVYALMHFFFSEVILKKKNRAGKFFDGFLLFGIGVLGIVMMFITLFSYYNTMFRIMLLLIELAVVTILAVRIRPLIREISK